MKTMLNMTRNSVPSYTDFSAQPQQPQSQQPQYNYYQPYSSAPKAAASENNIKDLEVLTKRIQSFLNSGSQALAIAEAKTEQVAKMQPETVEYKRMIEEVKAFQARAGYDFRQAETLLKTANSLLPEKKQ